MGDASELGMFGRAGSQLMRQAGGQLGGGTLGGGGGVALGGGGFAMGGGGLTLAGQTGSGSLGLQSGPVVGDQPTSLMPQPDAGLPGAGMGLQMQISGGLGQGMGMGQAMGLASNLKMLCGIHDDSCWDSVIGPVCYSTDTHKCINKRTLCGINNDVCGVICFDALKFRCDNGRILAMEVAAQAARPVQPPVQQQLPALPVQQSLPAQAAAHKAEPVTIPAAQMPAQAKPPPQIPVAEQKPSSQAEKPAQAAVTGSVSETDLRHTHGEPHVIECKFKECAESLPSEAQKPVQPAQQAKPAQAQAPVQKAKEVRAPPAQAKPSQQIPAPVAQKPVEQVPKPAQAAGLSETDLRRTHGEPHILECKSEHC